MAAELKRKVFCPACNRLLALSEGKDEGDEMECPFCLAQFTLEISRFYEGRVTKPSPFTFEDGKTPEAWRAGRTGG
jgi:hypothetical protein